MEIFEKNFIDKNKLKDVYDVFKYLYNTHSADTYLSNIKNESFTMNIWVSTSPSIRDSVDVSMCSTILFLFYYYNLFCNHARISPIYNI